MAVPAFRYSRIASADHQRGKSASDFRAFESRQAAGLGDAIFGREVELRGHAVETILPSYDCMRYDQIWGLQIGIARAPAAICRIG